jgi:uncharacterized protein (DUF934 family)
MMENTIKLIASCAESMLLESLNDTKSTLKIANDADVATFSASLSSALIVELHFPAFSDGRAFSQAIQLRKRIGFKGDIRATGDVLVDQVVQMQRSGFSSAVLRKDQSLEHATRLLSHYKGFYQGDVAHQAAFLTGQFA